MNNCDLRFHLVLFLALAFSCSMHAQSWDFAKEKEGIRLYTRLEEGKSLKSYKGVTDIQAPADRVFAMLEDVNHTEWWDKNLNQIKVLLYEKNRHAQYYLVYDLPWPVTDRDLCVDAKVKTDPVTGVRMIVAGPLPDVVPEHSDMVRIKDYRQTWTVKPTGKASCHVVLEGSVDPAGKIPDWILNLVIVDSPFKVMHEVKRRFEAQGTSTRK